MVSEQRSRDMAEGTRLSQLSETVQHLQAVTTKLTDEQARHGVLMEGILQQLNNLASSYEGLAHVTTRLNSGEGTSTNTRGNTNPLCEVNGNIQARSLRLDFPRFDGGDPS